MGFLRTFSPLWLHSWLCSRWSQGPPCLPTHPLPDFSDHVQSTRAPWSPSRGVCRGGDTSFGTISSWRTWATHLPFLGLSFLFCLMGALAKDSIKAPQPFASLPRSQRGTTGHGQVSQALLGKREVHEAAKSTFCWKPSEAPGWVGNA